MRLLNVTIQHESDVVLARQRARQIASLLGFDLQDQTRIATAVSEIARNAFTYAGRGKVAFTIEGKTAPQVLLISVRDDGPGIAALQPILDGEYKSSTGMGLGIIGARRLMDQFEILSAPQQGTTVRLKKLLPPKAPLITAQKLSRLAAELAREQLQDPFAEIQQQNQELLQALELLRARQDELVRLNRELEDTNRGVVALYAELDEKADHLRRADELKTRFLSNMSHEFRTPVNSILALSRLLLDHIDGELNSEQEKQVLFINKAAETLAELINDLLDIAKIEAGKVVVKPAEFEVSDLFSSLRGMLRPLLLNDAVQLVFTEPGPLPTLYSDEGKVSQILRNFLSNALKFTERGEIRVSATLTPAADAVVLAVADTGVGIAPEDQERIFQEFTQIDNPLQNRIKGTGLGLPLCQKLATLLEGTVAVESTVGVGSTFSVTLPVRYRAPVTAYSEGGIESPAELDPARLPVLVVEDEVATSLLYEKYLQDTPFQMIAAYSVREAEQVLIRVRPRAIVLDIVFPGKDAWEFLATLKDEEETRDIPILVVSTVEDQRKGLALGADAYKVKPVTREWVLEVLTRLTAQAGMPRVLIIDDEEVSRYVLKQCLSGIPYTIREATTGLEGLSKAQQERPDVIFLDLNMPGMDGYALLEQLKSDNALHSIPVIVNTAKALSETEQTWLRARTAAILPKALLSRETVGEAVRKALQNN